jgi:pimeloyl-ACP methyl ester carboxylesterase
VKPTVLLLHAFPLDARMWDGHREALEAEGYAVAAPSLPEHGDGSTFASWAPRVLGLVEGPFVPVGVSMGGYLIFELWRRASDRIPALALVDTRATPEPHEALPARAELIRVAREDGAEAVWERMRERLVAPGADPAIVGRAAEIVRSRPTQALVQTLEAIRDRADSVPTLATIGVPALVIVGAEDAITPPAAAREIADGITGARLVEIPGAGHLPPLERPEEFRSALHGFLREAVG